MHKVTGRIIAADDGAGVADLSVVIYDLDPSIQDRDQRIAQLTSRAISSLWSQIPGQRLGSVLTDESGEFELSFESGAFAAQDPGCRPDLILLVLAPDESRLVDDIAIAVPAAERILYCSTEAILNSGKDESMVIRLPSTLLRKHHLANRPSPERSKQTLEAIEATAKEEAQLHRAVEAANIARTVELTKPILKRQETVRKAFENFTLSSAPPERRAENTFIAPGEALKDKQAAVVDERLAMIPKTLDAGVERAMRLALKSEDLPDWGIDSPPTGDTFETTMSSDALFDKLKQRVRFGPLDRSRSWLEIECAELDAEPRLDAAIARCTEPEPDEVTGSDSETGVPELVIEDKLAEQLQFLAPPEEELKYGRREDGDITATITRPSPADVTRYYDFHDLQIAFDHIWSEALDERLPGLFKNVYDEIIRFQQRVSGQTIVRPVSTLDDMMSLYNEFRALQESMEAEQERPSEPPPVDAFVARAFPFVTPELWAVTTDAERGLLREWAQRPAFQRDKGELIREKLRADARELLIPVRERLPSREVGRTPTTPRSRTRLEKLFAEIDGRLAEPHKFDIFARNSVNFGVMLTYRQKWVPLDYQVGALVNTIPLAPKETRKYSTKRIVKKTRSEKQIEEREQSSKRERNNTSRADAEIVRQARNKTSFEQTASGTINVGVFEGTFGTRFGVESEKASSQTKKNFREAVLKAADEFKEKYTLEVETSISEETEMTSEGEISNPNDEIAVTYLFYELQRQYEISERLQRLTPVVLVANAVPRPDAIDEDWLLTHQWILERVLLDDSLRAAMLYLTNGLAGDELTLEALGANVSRQIALVEQLTRQVSVKTKLAEDSFEQLRALLNDPGDRGEKLKDIGMALALGPLALLMGGDDDAAAEKREEIAKMALERADKATQEVSARLTREVTALQQAIDKYVAALRAHFDHKMAIAKLRIHVKQNILYYMQAIWDHEPSDQRYFRLYNIEVPWLEKGATSFDVPVVAARRAGSGPSSAGDWNVKVKIPLSTTGGTLPERTTRKLHEVADLDNLLGYKGNYMIFPAREHSFLHLYMMQDYLDENGGVRDPDGPGYTSRELYDYICCLQRHAPQRVTDERELLLQMVKDRLTSDRPESELVVVPTDSLFIEALPGKHPVMEPFKIVHRALDVKKVQGEVRELEIDNLRRAARLMEGQLGDPDIDKLVRVEGVDEVEADV